MKNLVKTIQNTVFREGLWAKGSKIVLGVSGGPDSVCMLEVMTKIASKYDLELMIAHVNYGLRGKDSDRDEKFVKKLAKKYNLPVKIIHPKNVKVNENDLRDIRYKFFEEAREKNNFDLIAVAHNLDDQVETFLMRVIRGAGLAGLSAMKYKNGPPRRIIRPLLGISRKEILEYLKKTGSIYRMDKTNQKNLFFRNKVRNQLIPYLEKNFNPKIKETISAATTSTTEDYSFLNDYTKELMANKKDLSIKELLELHPALQRRVLLQYIASRRSDLKDIESSHIEEILRALRSTKGKNQFVVFKGLKLTKKGDKVIINCLDKLI
jgi:tRNA(Ile)-lysidine synthase